MTIRFWGFILALAWTVDAYADEFVEWAQQKYAQEIRFVRSAE